MCWVPFFKTSFDLKKMQSNESTLEISGEIRRGSLLFCIFLASNMFKKGGLHTWKNADFHRLFMVGRAPMYACTSTALYSKTMKKRLQLVLKSKFRFHVMIFWKMPMSKKIRTMTWIIHVRQMKLSPTKVF